MFDAPDFERVRDGEFPREGDVILTDVIDPSSVRDGDLPREGDSPRVCLEEDLEGEAVLERDRSLDDGSTIVHMDLFDCCLF